MRIAADLEVRLYNWLEPLAAVVGINEIIFSGQQNDNVRPDTQFIAVQLVDQAVDDRPEVRMIYDPADVNLINENIIYNAYATVLLKLFTDTDPVGKMQHLKAMLQSNQSQDLQYLQNLYYSAAGTITTVTADNARADMQLIFSYSYTYENKIGTIGEVRIVGTDADTGNTIIDQTINEP